MVAVALLSTFASVVSGAADPEVARKWTEYSELKNEGMTFYYEEVVEPAHKALLDEIKAAKKTGWEKPQRKPEYDVNAGISKILYAFKYAIASFKPHYLKTLPLQECKSSYQKLKEREDGHNRVRRNLKLFADQYTTISDLTNQVYQDESEKCTSSTNGCYGFTDQCYASKDETREGELCNDTDSVCKCIATASYFKTGYYLTTLNLECKAPEHEIQPNEAECKNALRAIRPEWDNEVSEPIIVVRESGCTVTRNQETRKLCRDFHDLTDEKIKEKTEENDKNNSIDRSLPNMNDKIMCNTGLQLTTCDVELNATDGLFSSETVSLREPNTYPERNEDNAISLCKLITFAQTSLEKYMSDELDKIEREINGVLTRLDI